MNMNSFLAIVILSVSLTLSNAFAVNTENKNLIDYRLNWNLNYSSTFDDRDKKCDKTGPMCKNCDRLVNCISKPNGDWKEIAMAECSKSDLVCGGAQCKPKQEVPECSSEAKLDFRCWMAGIFPDPADCKKYHVCYIDGSSTKSAEMTCENSDQYYYNPKTLYCDKSLPTNGQCSAYPIPLCNKAGDTFPIKENPKIFYTCANYPDRDKVLYPFQMVCPNGKSYSTDISGCK